MGHSDCDINHPAPWTRILTVSLAMPGEEQPKERPPKAAEVKAALQTVVSWVKASGSVKEEEFFNSFTQKIDMEVNKEKKQQLIEVYLANRNSRGETPGTSGVEVNSSAPEDINS